MLDKTKSVWQIETERRQAAEDRIIKAAACLADYHDRPYHQERHIYLESLAIAVEWKSDSVFADHNMLHDALFRVATAMGFGDLPADLTPLQLAQVIAFVLQHFEPKKKARKS